MQVVDAKAGYIWALTAAKVARCTFMSELSCSGLGHPDCCTLILAEYTR